MTTLSDWLRLTLELLVDDPSAVSLSEIEGEQARVYEVSVAKEDVGKVIGRKGQTADAIRWILYAVSNRERKRTLFQIIDP